MSPDPTLPRRRTAANRRCALARPDLGARGEFRSFTRGASRAQDGLPERRPKSSRLSSLRREARDDLEVLYCQVLRATLGVETPCLREGSDGLVEPGEAGLSLRDRARGPRERL